MAEKKLDFLSRRPVQAVIMISLDTSETLAASRLPEGYFLDNGIFRFPAGYWESYFVNGKEYNADGNRTTAEQQELITKDLTEEGFGPKEIEEFIAEIETKEGLQMSLTPDASNSWLKYHPEFETEALHLLSEIKKEVQNEAGRDFRGGMSRR